MADDSDPMHRDSGPHVQWTTTNAGEAFPGVVTPLSWSFVGDGAELVLRRPAYAVGALSRRESRLPAEDRPRYIQAFFGRIAMQVDYFALLGDRMPGSTGREIVANTLGRVPEGMTFHPTIRRYPLVMVRLPYCFVAVQRRIRLLGEQMHAWHTRQLADAPELDRDGALSLFLDAKQRFERAGVLHGLVLFAVVQPLYAALTQLVGRAGVGDVGTLSGTFGVETSEMISDIWDLSRGRTTLDVVVAKHGFHGPMEGEMSSRVWREDAAPLRRMVAEYAQRDDAENPRLRERTRITARDRTARAVLAALPAWQRPGARLVLRLASRGIPLRGIGKVAFLQAIDIGRVAARRLGTILVDQGVLHQADDVFYLTVPELTGQPDPRLREVVEQRKRLRQRYLALSLPSDWQGMPEPVALTDRGRRLEAGETLEGIGVSSGVVEGTVRVVTDPDFMEVEPGEILVAQITDPSWSSIMFISDALVVDLGGALSHAAIVARELGIPCVVNTRNGTSVLHTGDRIRVDGDSGTVEMLAAVRPARDEEVTR